MLLLARLSALPFCRVVDRRAAAANACLLVDFIRKVKGERPALEGKGFFHEGKAFFHEGKAFFNELHTFFSGSTESNSQNKTARVYWAECDK